MFCQTKNGFRMLKSQRLLAFRVSGLKYRNDHCVDAVNVTVARYVPVGWILSPPTSTRKPISLLLPVSAVSVFSRAIVVVAPVETAIHFSFVAASALQVTGDAAYPALAAARRPPQAATVLGTFVLFQAVGVV